MMNFTCRYFSISSQKSPISSSQYTLVKQYLGLSLFRYSLNIEKNYNLEKLYSNLTLEQRKSIKLIYNFIKRNRISFIKEDGFLDGFYIGIGIFKFEKNIFETSRKLCGGNFPNIFSYKNDEILYLLVEIGLEIYPFFLMEGAITNHSIRFSFLSQRIHEKHQNIVDFMKKDIIDNLTNKKHDDYFDYKFCFSMENMSFSMEISTVFYNLILGSFVNCCRRNVYDPISFFEEIKLSLEKLRSLSQKKSVDFSYFVGVRGIIMNGIEKMQVRNIKLVCIDNENPIFSVINNYGGFIEINYSEKIKKIDDKNVGYHDHSKVLNEKIRDLLENIKFSICVASEKKYSFSVYCYQNAFPLIHPINMNFNSDAYPKKQIEITQKEFEKFVIFYEKISNLNKDKIKLTIQRLDYAIHERKNPDDSIVDSIIAWESMFGGKQDTGFKVTSSIAVFLKNGNERKKFLKRIKKLYGLRSEIVHGSERNALKNEKKEDLCEETINIALECLEKLIENKELLEMSPEDRVKKILLDI